MKDIIFILGVVSFVCLLFGAGFILYGLIWFEESASMDSSSIPPFIPEGVTESFEPNTAGVQFTLDISPFAMSDGDADGRDLNVIW